MTEPMDHDTFTEAMKDLHRRSDFMPTRKISAESDGIVTHATAHNILRGHISSSWLYTEAVIVALGGNPDEFKPLWINAVAAKRDAQKRLRDMRNKSGKPVDEADIYHALQDLRLAVRHMAEILDTYLD